MVAGKWHAKDLLNLIKDGHGKAMIKTLSGGTLTAWLKGKDVYVTTNVVILLK